MSVYRKTTWWERFLTAKEPDHEWKEFTMRFLKKTASTIRRKYGRGCCSQTVLLTVVLGSIPILGIPCCENPEPADQQVELSPDNTDFYTMRRNYFSVLANGLHSESILHRVPVSRHYAELLATQQITVLAETSANLWADIFSGNVIDGFKQIRDLLNSVYACDSPMIQGNAIYYSGLAAQYINLYPDLFRNVPLFMEDLKAIHYTIGEQMEYAIIKQDGTKLRQMVEKERELIEEAHQRLEPAIEDYCSAINNGQVPIVNRRAAQNYIQALKEPADQLLDTELNLLNEWLEKLPSSLIRSPSYGMTLSTRKDASILSPDLYLNFGEAIQGQVTQDGITRCYLQVPPSTDHVFISLSMDPSDNLDLQVTAPDGSQMTYLSYRGITEEDIFVGLQGQWLLEVIGNYVNSGVFTIAANTCGSIRTIPSSPEQGEEFVIEVEGMNPSTFVFNNVKARLDFTEPLNLAPGESSEKSIGNLVPGGTVAVSWRVIASEPGLMSANIGYDSSVLSGSIRYWFNVKSKSTKLTDWPVGQQECTFNRSGRLVAYRNLPPPHDWTNSDIWVMNPDGSGNNQITFDSSGEFNPRFRSDGRISYVKEFGSNEYDIWLVNADGSNPCELIGGSLRQGGAGHDWHPTQLKIAYTNEYLRDAGEIWTAKAEGCGKVYGKRMLTNHNVDGYSQDFPVWSNLGDKIAYGNMASKGAVHHVWVMNSDGSGKHQITFGSGEEPMFWWPDDSFIGYGKNYEVWLHHLATGTDKLLLSLPNGQIGSCDLSPDGKLVFTLSDASGTHIWIADIITGPGTAMEIRVGSPVDLHVYDAQLRHAGVNYETGEVVTDIPGASYSGPGTEPQIIRIEDPGSGTYTIGLIGTDMGGYSIALTGYIGNEVVSSDEFAGYISQGEAYESEATISAIAGAIGAITIDVTEPVLSPTNVGDNVGTTVSHVGYDWNAEQFGLDVIVLDRSSAVIGIPLWLTIESISDASVTLANRDGITADGKPYIDLSELLDGSQLGPSQSVTKRIYFNNPDGVRFTFEPGVRGVILEEPAPGPLEQILGLSRHWLGSEGSLDVVPAGGDGIINFRDFAVMAEDWLNKEE